MDFHSISPSFLVSRLSYNFSAKPKLPVNRSFGWLVGGWGKVLSFFFNWLGSKWLAAPGGAVPFRGVGEWKKRYEDCLRAVKSYHLGKIKEGW